MMAFHLTRISALLVLLGSPCFPVNAQEQQGVSGIGAQKCVILTARATAGTNPNDMAVVSSWVQGFVSGLNMNAENEFYYDLTSMPENEQNVQILAYCRNHPSEVVMNAGLNLAQTFLARKPTQPR